MKSKRFGRICLPRSNMKHSRSCLVALCRMASVYARTTSEEAKALLDSTICLENTETHGLCQGHHSMLELMSKPASAPDLVRLSLAWVVPKRVSISHATWQAIGGARISDANAFLLLCTIVHCCCDIFTRRHSGTQWKSSVKVIFVMH